MSYDSSTGRIYIDTSTNPDTGVSIADVQAALGSPKNDIGQLITATDASNKPLVNKFAKYKPVRYPSVSATKDSVPTLYRDINQKCGIEIPVLDATDFADSSIQSMITGASDYSYIRPRGKDTNSEWYRFLDFNGYDKYADINFQFVPPTVSQAGYININGEHTFTLRFGNLYTNTGTISASVLSLVDLMMRFADNGGNLYVYNSKNPQSWASSNDITNDLSYGFLGIILIYTSSIDNSVQVCMRSHSLGINSSGNNELAIDFSTIYAESGAPNPDNGDTVFLAPCFTNLNSEGEWVALISNTSYPSVKCGLFPKVSSGSTSVDYVSYTLYTPVVTLAELSYSIYGASLISGYTNAYRVTSSSASYVAITVTAGTGTLGTNNTYKITNVNGSYSGAVNNTLTGNLTFNNNRQASFQINLKDGNNNSIFIENYISLGVQIISTDGAYQNDTIQIFAYNA